MVYEMIASIQMQLTHLHILDTKAMLGHVERITQHSEAERTHNSSIQIRFKLNGVKGVQVIAPTV
jgi:hypothetical protein